MPVINFQVPAGFIQGDPNNAANYVNGQADLNALQALLNQPGVYIWGVKDENGKFCPLYIGIRKIIWSRIIEHYVKHSFMNSSTNGLFDLNQLFQNPLNFYTTTLFNFNEFWVSRRHTKANMERMLTAPINLKDSLVFFRSSRAMNRHCNLQDNLHPIHNLQHITAIAEYNALFNAGYKCLGALAQRMIATKNIIENNFYFVYAPFNGPDGIIQSILDDGSNPILVGLVEEYLRNGIFNIGNAYGAGGNIALRVETATKAALNKINLHTISKAAGALYHFDIDLTAIQNGLINVGGYVYPNNYGNAGDPPLIIPVP